MSNRADVSAILADIDDTISRARDLSPSPGRAAALQCLADARAYLARTQRDSDILSRYSDILERVAYPSVPPSATGPAVVPKTRAELLEMYPPRDSTPPSATDNQPTRNKANECFRESRRLLREVIK